MTRIRRSMTEKTPPMFAPRLRRRDFPSHSVPSADGLERNGNSALGKDIGGNADERHKGVGPWQGLKMDEPPRRRPVVTLAALYGAGGTVVGPRVAERL